MKKASTGVAEDADVQGEPADLPGSPEPEVDLEHELGPRARRLAAAVTIGDQTVSAGDDAPARDRPATARRHLAETPAPTTPGLIRRRDARDAA